MGWAEEGKGGKIGTTVIHNNYKKEKNDYLVHGQMENQVPRELHNGACSITSVFKVTKVNVIYLCNGILFSL